MTDPQQDELNKIMWDIYMLGRTDNDLKVDDYTTLRPKLKAALTQYIEREVVKARIAEVAHWASFFEDPSMNSKTPSERLHDRVTQLAAQLNKDLAQYELAEDWDFGVPIEEGSK